jgi:hypothetical protein
MVKILELIMVVISWCQSLIGYVMNTLMNEGKMVRGEEKHGCC